MKRRIKLVRNDKTHAFSEGLNKLLGEINKMTYREYQTCLAYFSFVMARRIMRSEEIKKFGANTVLRETLADMKAPCIFGVEKAGEVEFPQEIKEGKVCAFLGGDGKYKIWDIDMDA